MPCNNKKYLLTLKGKILSSLRDLMIQQIEIVAEKI